MREIEDVGRPVEDVEAHGDQRIKAAGDESVRDRRRDPSSASCPGARARKQPIARGSWPEATETSTTSLMPIAGVVLRREGDRAEQALVALQVVERRA